MVSVGHIIFLRGDVFRTATAILSKKPMTCVGARISASAEGIRREIALSVEVNCYCFLDGANHAQNSVSDQNACADT